jgi:hypothetical protein
MSFKKILQENPNLTIKGLQKLQSEYDDRFISDSFSGFSKVRHTYSHMGKLIGRLAEYIHDMEEGREVSAEDIKTKVIPDLLVYSAWLAKEFGVNMEGAYLKRFIGNIKRLHANKISQEELDELEKCVADKTKP